MYGDKWIPCEENPDCIHNQKEDHEIPCCICKRAFYPKDWEGICIDDFYEKGEDEK